jgi:hypothetical protein
MDASERLYRKIYQHFAKGECNLASGGILQGHEGAEIIAKETLEIIDSFIENEYESEEIDDDSDVIRKGDAVRLVRRLEEGDDSRTSRVCAVTDEMEDILVGTLGEVREIDDELGSALVDFTGVGNSWNFHVDDLAKVK